MFQMVKAVRKYWNTHIVRSDFQGIIFCSLIWIVIGIFNVYSSGMIAKGSGTVEFYQTNYFKHIVFLIFSSLIGLFFYKVDYQNFRSSKYTSPGIKVLMFLVIVALIGVLIFAESINGAKRWIQLGSVISIQPSEFAKLFSILWAAHWIDLQHRKQRYLSWFETYTYKGPITILQDLTQRGRKVPAIALWLPLLYAVLTLVEPDTGTALLIAAIPVMMMMLSGLSRRSVMIMLTGVAVAIPIAIIGIMNSAYRKERILAWWDPWGFEKTLSYQSVQSMIAIGSGGVFGQGLAQGTAKYHYLPEAHTDFAFAVWSQETGLIGSLFLIIVVAMFIYYGLNIAIKAKDYYGKLLAAGITLIIGGQAVFNMIMVSGLIPVTGVPLPFVSYGGSSLLTNIIALAILFNVAHRSEMARKKIGVSGHIPSLREETRSRFSPAHIE